MNDTPTPEVPTETPPPPPPAPPTPAPAPDKDLATALIELAEVYRPRLYAIKQGLFEPAQLVNQSWSYYPALVETDRSYISGQIVETFKQLETQLVKEMSERIAALIGR